MAAEKEKKRDTTMQQVEQDNYKEVACNCNIIMSVVTHAICFIQ